MTERGAAAVGRDARELRIGPGALRWDGDSLLITLRERGMPLPRAIRGEVRVHPQALTGFSAALDAPARHRWRPIAPRARVEVSLTHPALRWSGPGYLDSNDGDAPLEEGFRRWDWCRAPLPDGATAIHYDTEPLDGPPRSLSLRVAPDGAVRHAPPPPAVPLGRSRWGIGQGTRSEAGARVLRPLVDAPFYARSEVEVTLDGARVAGMHESVDLRRFAAPWVQAMLPFRMPRRG